MKLYSLNDENIKKLGKLSQEELDEIKREARQESQMLENYKNDVQISRKNKPSIFLSNQDEKSFEKLKNWILALI